MSKPKVIKLCRGERIIAVVPERCAGPGWSNFPIYVYIEQNGGKLRTECFQPEEWGPELTVLAYAGEAMCRALIAAIPTRENGKVKK